MSSPTVPHDMPVPAPTIPDRRAAAMDAPPRPAHAWLPIAVDAQARRVMIAQAAYFRAQKRGFAAGGELDDWLEAEREIARMLDG